MERKWIFGSAELYHNLWLWIHSVRSLKIKQKYLEIKMATKSPAANSANFCRNGIPTPVQSQDHHNPFLTPLISSDARIALICLLSGGQLICTSSGN